MALRVPPRELLVSPFNPFILGFFFRLFFVLQHARGVVLTSWFRTFDENVSEGGDPESQHLFGLAADLDVPSGSVGGVLGLARGTGLVAVDERTHVHIQLFPAGALSRAGVIFPTA